MIKSVESKLMRGKWYETLNQSSSDSQQEFADHPEEKDSLRQEKETFM
jgi:hypothetical protein